VSEAGEELGREPGVQAWGGQLALSGADGEEVSCRETGVLDLGVPFVIHACWCLSVGEALSFLPSLAFQSVNVVLGPGLCTCICVHTHVPFLTHILHVHMFLHMLFTPTLISTLTCTFTRSVHTHLVCLLTHTYTCTHTHSCSGLLAYRSQPWLL
jgi:hypothetical protein